MATAPAQPEQISTLARLAASELTKQFSAQYSMSPEDMLNTLLQTVFPHGPNDPVPTMAQVRMFLAVANEYHLNPFTRQIYAFPSKGGGVVPIVSIDGWVELVNRNKDFNGVEYVYNNDAAGKLVSITCRMFHKNRDHATEVTEFMDECVRSTEPWTKSPKRMLRHKVYIQTGRVAFGLSGIYDEDEAERIIEAEIIQHDPQAKDNKQIAGQTAKGTADLKTKLAEAKAAQDKIDARKASAPIPEVRKPELQNVVEHPSQLVTDEDPENTERKAPVGECVSPADVFETRGREPRGRYAL